MNISQSELVCLKAVVQTEEDVHVRNKKLKTLYSKLLEFVRCKTQCGKFVI